jgi:hypothetical protein
MTAALRRLAIAALCLGFAEGAAARDLRHPEQGTPAFTLQVPDDWQHEVDPDKNLIVTSADASTSLVFTWGSFGGDLENAAKLMLKTAGATPPTGKTQTAISGQAGYSFDSTLNVEGKAMQLRMTIVRVGEKGFGSGTKIELTSNTPQQRQRADSAMSSLRIVGGGTSQGNKQ